jgi:hypothetical protein
MTESVNDPDARLGDDGRALGRFQCHPDRLWSEAHRYQMQPRLGETWDSFITRVVTAMHAHWQTRGKADLEIAMFWHLGHFAAPESIDYDHEYAKRFSLYES